jgi:hypothetical protein
MCPGPCFDGQAVREHPLFNLHDGSNFRLKYLLGEKDFIYELMPSLLSLHGVN